MTPFLTIIGGLLGTLFIGRLLSCRQKRLLQAENETRQQLGLPPLTRHQFQLQVVEKSAEFRSNVNQHM